MSMQEKSENIQKVYVFIYMILERVKMINNSDVLWIDVLVLNYFHIYHTPKQQGTLGWWKSSKTLSSFFKNLSWR